MGFNSIAEKVERLPSRTPAVEEWLCRWRGRRPMGASSLLRLSLERELPTCHRLLTQMELQDVERRIFNPWRALRRGVDDDGLRWSLHQHHPGVVATTLLERLGAGDAAPEVVAHLMAGFTERLSLFEMRDAEVDVDGTPRPAWARRSRAILLPRPIAFEHLRIGFDGDVDIEVVTDSFARERSFTLGIGERDPLWAEADRWLDEANDLVRGFCARLAGASVQRAATVEVEASGRATVKGMLAALFPEELRLALDRDELAGIT